MAEHIAYEAWMLDTMSRRLSTSGLERSTRNAILESFLVHCRAIIDFLYGSSDDPKVRPDDVLAEDFLPSAVDDWRKAREQMSVEMKEALTRINKEVAHLTYERLNVVPDLKAHDVAKLRDTCLSLLKTFLRYAGTGPWSEHLDRLSSPATTPLPEVPPSVLRAWFGTSTR